MRRHPAIARSGALLLGFALLILVVPSAALGSTAGMQDENIVFEADVGEVNQIGIRTWHFDFPSTPYDDTTQYFITDNGPEASITPGDGCQQGQDLTTGAIEPETVVCPIAGSAKIVGTLGDQMDTWAPREGALTLASDVDAGEDDDTITGSDTDDALAGGEGRDSLRGDVEQTTGDGGDDVLQGGPGDDSLDARHGSDFLDGGEGPDRLSAGTGDDELHGGDDPDLLSGDDGDDDLFGEGGDENPLADDGLSLLVPGLTGGPGNDTVDGGDGDDDLRGDTGLNTAFEADDTDVLRGGPDRDSTSYNRRDNDVLITLDDQANDGEVDPGDPQGLTSVENDDIGSDIEQVSGGSGHDLIFGTAAPQNLIGLAGDDGIAGDGGNDLIEGREGDDTLLGEIGNDVISGRSGDDLIEGGEGNDELQGGNDADQITGNGGTDVFRGDSDIGDGTDGPDAIFARDGIAERIICGEADDIGLADSNDVFSTTGAQGCEGLARPAPPAGGGGQPQTPQQNPGPQAPAGPQGQPAVEFKPRKTQGLRPILRAGGVWKLKAGADRAGGFDTVVTATRAAAKKVGLAARRSVVIARGKAKLKGPGKVTIRVKLTKKARKRLRRARRLKVTVTTKFKDAAGRVTTKKRTVTLKR